MNALAEKPELLGVTDLAAFFGFTTHTIYKWNKNGTGPKRIKIGNKVFYRRADVQAWIDAKESK